MHSGLLTLLARYPDGLLIFVSVALFSCVVTGAGYWLALRTNLLPSIRQRDVHVVRKPRVGGVAMWLAITLTFLVIQWQRPELLHFGQIGWGGDTHPLGGVLGALLVLLIFGLMDDIGDLPARWIALSQFLAGLCLVIAGVGITYIQLPFGHQLFLDTWQIQTPTWLAGGLLLPWSGLFTIVWTMVVINIFNFFDGLDGLAGSVAMTAAIILLFVSLSFGFTATATLSVVTAGAVLGFLPWNWHPSRLFMGTVGSQTLGFLLAVIAIISGGKVATAVLVLGVPLIDSVIVVISRLRAGVSPFQADQRHLHHRLLRIGLTPPQIALLVASVSTLFGVLALHTQTASGKGALTLVLVLFLLLLIGLTYWLEHRSLAKSAIETSRAPGVH
jgi:UDP-GlcNAc:undecaprenyl-phosphate GlcNAc-1-phosphate transferase